MRGKTRPNKRLVEVAGQSDVGQSPVAPHDQSGGGIRRESIVGKHEAGPGKSAPVEQSFAPRPQ